ncbi:MAG: tripartite tricarboxylate transporter substrate-binding protein [Pseudomonadota bacterium]|nr:tripartite tricarboxylate transporter substrate-binding protein [Pseudomonadota bacterium]
MIRILHSLLAGVALVGAVTAANAQAWPTKPIRIIVPFAPGGGVDVLTRAVAAELQQKWGQGVYIENKPGAGSLIGAEIVAHAPPDGYTLMATVNQTVVANRYLYKNLPYDPDKSFEPITMMVVSDQLLLANSKFPANNLKEMIALAHKEPGKIAYGSYGLGSQPNLLYETIKVHEHIDLLHVPYKGITPNLTALAAGDVMLGTGSVAVATPLIQTGRIKPISVAGAHRVSQFPNVPTTTEEGYPYVRASIWYALFAPAGTPEPIVAKIRSDVRAILTDPAFAKMQATSKGLTVVAGDKGQLVDEINEEAKIVGEQIKAAGVKPE